MINDKFLNHKYVKYPLTLFYILFFFVFFRSNTISAQPDNNVFFSCFSENRGFIFSPHDVVNFQILFDNLNNGSQYTAQYRVYDYWGAENIYGDIKLGDVKDKRLNGSLLLQTGKVGWYRVEIYLYYNNVLVPLINKQIPWIKNSFTFAVLHGQPRGDDSSPFGINEHYLNDDIARLIKIAGISWLRTNAFWSRIEKLESRFSWDSVDQIISLARQFDIALLMVVAYGTDWASTAPQHVKGYERTRYQPKLSLYINFLNLLIDRYQKAISSWEIWNEPNIGFWKSPKDDYADFLKISYSEIKKYQSFSTVLMGGLSGAPIDWLDMLQRKKAGNAYDVYNIHPYYYDSIPEEQLENDLSKFIKKVDEVRNAPIWITEMGAPTNKVTLYDQSSLLVRGMVIALSYGVKKVFWYELADNRIDVNDKEANFGILFSDLSPKPAYVAYTILTRILSAAQFKEKIDLGIKDTYGYLFSRANDDVIVLWTINKEGQPIAFHINADKAKVVDVMGEENLVYAKEGNILLRLSQSPVYIIVQNQLNGS